MTNLSQEMKNAIKRRQEMIKLIMNPEYDKVVDGTTYPVFIVPINFETEFEGKKVGFGIILN